MEEEYLFEETGEGSVLLGETDPTPEEESTEEESTEEESMEEESTEEESTEVEPIEVIDYSDILTDIHSEISSFRNSFDSYVDYQKQNIFDKPISDFTVLEFCGLVFLITVFVRCLSYVIEKFTPQIWH